MDNGTKSPKQQQKIEEIRRRDLLICKIVHTEIFYFLFFLTKQKYSVYKQKNRLPNEKNVRMSSHL